ncbi:MAG: uracil-DNA glycosylase family protein [Opitutaceae bacterium]|nr:uracil-DNA glycosylase family protein [Opitutaceae bacterium]
MKEALHAIAEELRRLRSLGVRTVPVSEEALQALRSAVAAQGPVATVQSEPPQTAVVAETTPPTPAKQRAERPAAPSREPAAKPRTLPLAPPPFTLGEGTKQERWERLREGVLGDPVCQAQLRPGKKVVLGVGDLDATVFFCGEAPGAEEEVEGEPFVGPAGQKLTRIINAMDLSREQVYIGNIMNWRPRIDDQTGPEQTGNRPPTDEELGYCLPYLKAQLAIVQPRVIVALGATAAKGLLGPGSFRQVGEVRGRWLAYEGIPLRVTYHPSYLLRQDDMGKVAGMRARRSVWEDMLQVMEHLGMPISEKQRGYFLKT